MNSTFLGGELRFGHSSNSLQNEFLAEDPSGLLKPGTVKTQRSENRVMLQVKSSDSSSVKDE